MLTVLENLKLNYFLIFMAIYLIYFVLAQDKKNQIKFNLNIFLSVCVIFDQTI